MSDITRDEIDAKIAASEARGDTKFTAAMGKLDLLGAKIDAVVGTLAEVRADNRTTKSTIITSAVALFLGLGALIVGIAFGIPAIYTLGTQTRDIVRDEVRAAIPAQVAPALPQAPPAK